MKQMDTKKAIRHDDIPAETIKKNTFSYLSSPHWFHIPKLMFSRLLKIAHVKTVFMKGDKFHESNYLTFFNPERHGKNCWKRLITAN